MDDRFGEALRPFNRNENGHTVKWQCNRNGITAQEGKGQPFTRPPSLPREEARPGVQPKTGFLVALARWCAG